MNPRMQARLEAMTTDLSLTPEQANELTQIFKQSRQNIKELKQQNADRDQLRKGREQRKQNILTILNEEQKRKYNENEEKYRQMGKNENEA
jgi:Spy/CpxP family protein refolding chaperone